MDLTFQGYTVLGKLGAGGLADVFEGVDSAGKHAALKVLREPERGAPHLKRFLREGRLLKRMDHPALPRCLDVVEGERPFIVLECLKGETLAQHFRREGPVSPERALEIASCLLDVLAYLHGQGVVHRDVKSANIFLEEDGRVLLMDLGLAGDPIDPLTTTLGDVMGTFAYMAPEQIAGGELDHRADLYSLGVTLFEALSGSRPFGARGAAGTLQAQRKQGAAFVQERLPESTPGRLVEVITRLMSWDPAARPTSARMALAILTGREGLRRDLSAPPLVGRSAAMGAIEGVLDGGGGIQLVGEAGAGGGRMARVAWQMAQGRNVEVLGVRCRRKAPPMDPLDQLGSQVRAILEGGTLPLDDGLAALGGEGPVLLLIEDLEQASPEALEALARLVDVPGIRMVATASRVVEELPVRVLTLRPLRPAELTALISGMLGGATPPPGLAEELHRLTSGFAALSVASLRDLHERGVLAFAGLNEEGEVQWRLEGSVTLSQAAMISERIQDFARGLEPEPRRLLEVLSVAQEDLPLEVALKAAGQASDSMSPFSLIREGIVRERRDPGGEWLGLTRPITATSVLAELETEAIRLLHADLVTALSGLEESPWREYRISFHRAFAASAEDAPRALVSLGEWMARKHYYSRALEMLDHATTDVQMDPLTAIHCALARGSALQGLSRTLEAGEAMVAARRLAEEQGRGDLRSRALLALAEVRRVYGSSTRSAAAAREVLQGLSGPFLDRFRGPVSVLMGCAACRQGKLSKGEDLLRKSLLDGDAEQTMRAQTALADCLQLLGRVEEAETELAAVLADLGADDSPVLQVEALYRMSCIQLSLGRANLANQSLDQIDSLTRRRGLSRLGVAVSTGRAAVHLACGDLEGCGRFLRMGQGLDRAPTRVRLDWWELRARHRLALGDRPAAMAAHHRGKEEAEMVGWLSRRAYHVGMEAVLTGRGEALSKALKTLTEAGVEGYRARVLLLGVAVGGDDEVFSVALEASRRSGDRFLLLSALERACTPEALVEASELVRSCARQMHGELLSGFRSTTVARWVEGQA